MLTNLKVVLQTSNALDKIQLEKKITNKKYHIDR